MKYTQEERLEIGRRIYEEEISQIKAAEHYDISLSSARNYLRLYRDQNKLAPKDARRHSCKAYTKIPKPKQRPGLEDYESMTKEQLIIELVKARITEERLKKGYELKGDGRQKGFN